MKPPKKTPCSRVGNQLRVRFSLDGHTVDLGYFDAQEGADLAYAEWMGKYCLIKSNQWFDYLTFLREEAAEREEIDQEREEVYNAMYSGEYESGRDDY